MPRIWPKKFAILSADAASATCSWPTTNPKSRCLLNGCGTKRKKRSSVHQRIRNPLLHGVVRFGKISAPPPLYRFGPRDRGARRGGVDRGSRRFRHQTGVIAIERILQN